MRQRPRANKVNAQVGERADIAGVHVARALGLGAAGDKLNRGSHVVVGHVVEHDDVSAGLHSLAHHVQVLALDLDRRGKRCMGARHLNRTRHAAGGIDMVVLEHDGRRQVVTVVAAAADLDRGFLEDTHARRGLARIDEHGLGALEHRSHLMCIGSDTAHALQVVERHALARKQHARIAAHLAHVVAGVHLVTVGNIKQHRALRIQQLKGASEHIQARDDAIGLGDKLHRGGTRRGAHARRAHVLKRNVLAQGLQNQIIDDELHGNGIHGLLLHGLRADGTGQIIDCQGVGAQSTMTAIERGIARLLHGQRLAGTHVPRGATTPDQCFEQAV